MSASPCNFLGNTGCMSEHVPLPAVPFVTSMQIDISACTQTAMHTREHTPRSICTWAGPWVAMPNPSWRQRPGPLGAYSAGLRCLVYAHVLSVGHESVGMSYEHARLQRACIWPVHVHVACMLWILIALVALAGCRGPWDQVPSVSQRSQGAPSYLARLCICVQV